MKKLPEQIRKQAVSEDSLKEHHSLAAPPEGQEASGGEVEDGEGKAAEQERRGVQRAAWVLVGAALRIAARRISAND